MLPVFNNEPTPKTKSIPMVHRNGGIFIFFIPYSCRKTDTKASLNFKKCKFHLPSYVVRQAQNNSFYENCLFLEWIHCFKNTKSPLPNYVVPARKLYKIRNISFKYTLNPYCCRNTDTVASPRFKKSKYLLPRLRSQTGPKYSISKIKKHS